MSKALDDIEKLVEIVAKAATSDAIPLQEKMDALKLLAPYYTVLKKADTRSLGDDDGETMAGMQRALAEVEESGDGGIETASRRTRN